MLIEKDKISKRKSYVLRSSFLEEAIQNAGIGLDIHLKHSDGKRFFDAYFWPRGANASYERLYIVAGAVSSDQAKVARTFVEEAVVPELVLWITDILALPSDSPIRRQEQAFHRDFC